MKKKAAVSCHQVSPCHPVMVSLKGKLWVPLKGARRNPVKKTNNWEVALPLIFLCIFPSSHENEWEWISQLLISFTTEKK